MARRFLVAASVLAVGLVPGCARREAAPIAVRNHDYLVARSIRRDADATHTIRVDLPHAGGGYGYASAAPILDLTAVDLAGRISPVAGPASRARRRSGCR